MKENEHFIDTNIFLRPILKDDKKKVNECRDLLEKVKKGEFKAVTAPIVFAEVVWTTKRRYKIKKKGRIEALRALAGLNNLKFKEEFDIIKAINIYEGAKVKFVDALIGSMLHEEENATIISYDTDFDKIKGVTRKEPSQLL